MNGTGKDSGADDNPNQAQASASGGNNEKGQAANQKSNVKIRTHEEAFPTQV